jgi:hypothetical protein
VKPERRLCYPIALATAKEQAKKERIPTPRSQIMPQASLLRWRRGRRRRGRRRRREWRRECGWRTGTARRGRSGQTRRRRS